MPRYFGFQNEKAFERAELMAAIEAEFGVRAASEDFGVTENRVYVTVKKLYEAKQKRALYNLTGKGGYGTRLGKKQKT